MRRAIPLLLASACATSPTPTSTCGNFAWLLGTWTSEDGASIEAWTRAPSGVLAGESKALKDGEVVFTETLRIEANGYHAAPQGQAPHTFPLDACGDTWATFRDPTHDWPQSLTYRRTGDTLTATVEGTQDGKQRTETWSWAAQ